MASELGVSIYVELRVYVREGCWSNVYLLLLLLCTFTVVYVYTVNVWAYATLCYYMCACNIVVCACSVAVCAYSVVVCA